MTRKQQIKMRLLFDRKKLAKGRQPTERKPDASFSKNSTQSIIRSHHQLNKQLSVAKSKGDEDQVGELEKRINDRGGLKTYQLASVQGQASDRGGDSSALLMDWLHDIKPTLTSLD